MKKAFGMICGLLLAACFAVGPASAKEKKDIIIGAIGDLSGPTAQLANLAYGRRDYFRYLNSKDGINGHQIDYTLVDGAEIIPIAIASYKRLITRTKPHVLFRWGTGGTKAVKMFSNVKDRVPGISCSHSEDVSSPKETPYDFTLGATYEDQIRMAMLVGKKEGAKRVAIMGPTMEYSRGPRDNVVKEKFFEKHGLNLVADINYNVKPTDLTPEMLRLKELKVDLVFVADVPAGVLPAIRSANKIGFDSKNIFTLHYSMHNVIPKVLGKAANGVRAFQLLQEIKDYKGTPVHTEITSFLKKHRRRNMDKWYLKGWLVGKSMGEAIKRALDKNNNRVPDDIYVFRKMIRDELEGIKNFDIGLGPDFPRMNFTNHRGFSDVRVMQVVDSKWKLISDGYVSFDDF